MVTTKRFEAEKKIQFDELAGKTAQLLAVMKKEVKLYNDAQRSVAVASRDFSKANSDHSAAIEALSAAENAVGLRVREPKEGFAEHLLASIREQKANNEVFKPIVGTAARREMTAESVEAIKGPEPAAENEHRQNLILDLDNDDESLLDDSVEEESEMEKGLVNDDEESSIEP